METLLKFKKVRVIPGHQGWIGWTPILVFTTLAICLKGLLPSWGLMWMVALAIFFGFKWWTWWRAISGGIPIKVRSFAYLFLWPGMDARRFLASPWSKRPGLSSWAWAFTKTAFGAGLIWGVARYAGHGLLAGWIGMIGLILLLHFGLFAVLALFWQQRGVCAQPLMSCPIVAHSISDFWGKRWNSGFRDIVFGLFFIRLAKRFKVIPAAIITFVLSAFIAVFWTLRILVDFFYFKHSDWPAGIQFVIGHLFLTALFTALAATYWAVLIRTIVK